MTEFERDPDSCDHSYLKSAPMGFGAECNYCGKGDMVAGNRPARQSIRVPDPDAGVGCVLLMGLVLIALAIVFLFALLIRAFI